MTEKPDTPKTTPRPAMPGRLGPRPLALHLCAAAMTWTGSRAALPLWKNGSLNWKPELRDQAKTLLEELNSSGADEFECALDKQIQARLARFLAAIECYRTHPYQRDLEVPPSIWSEGASRLLDYGVFGTADSTPVLVVPSLINRGYILDLNDERSLLRWLAAQQFRPFLVEWGAPSETERSFTLTDYIAGRLEAALTAVRQETGRKPLLVGYCMGGDLSLALALRRPEDISGLALLATPWDFHAESPDQGRLLATSLIGLSPVLELDGVLPVDIIQTLFAVLDPLMVPRKFLAFSRLDPASDKARDFVALEDWLNDGVSLAAPVARECLGGWYGENTPHKGRWLVAGQPVQPDQWRGPALCIVPAHDRIVPPGSAKALALSIPGCETWTPPVGHIGMVASASAEELVWQPLLTWLKAQAAQV